VIRRTLVAVGLAAAPAYANVHHGGTGGNPTSPPAVNPYAAAPLYPATVYVPDPSPRVVVREVSPCAEPHAALDSPECSQFGEWSKSLRLPAFFVDAGADARRVPLTLGGSSAFAAASVLRVGMALTPHMYAALEGELGGITSVTGATGSGTVGGTYLGGFGVVGARVARGPSLLALEVAGGGRDVQSSGMPLAVHGLDVETRARGEVWLGPWLTVGAALGTSVQERGDWMASVYLGMHSHAFAGSR
jgi:hypothetical protein